MFITTFFKNYAFQIIFYKIFYILKLFAYCHFKNRSILLFLSIIFFSSFSISCRDNPKNHEGNSQTGDPAIFAFTNEQKAIHKKPITLTYGYNYLSDYSHKIELLKNLNIFKAGDATILPVRLTNTGLENWPAKRPIRPLRADESRFEKFGDHAVTIGFRWFDLSGEMKNGVNYYLPHDIPSGESIIVDLVIEVPIVPGSYKLYIFLSQGNRKFYDHFPAPLVLSPNVVH
jgi:hypothetical protein